MVASGFTHDVAMWLAETVRDYSGTLGPASFRQPSPAAAKAVVDRLEFPSKSRHSPRGGA